MHSSTQAGNNKDAWLNDVVIYEILLHFSVNTDVWVIDSLFIEAAFKRNSFPPLEPLLGQAYQRIILPCLANSHWFLVAIDLSTNSFILFTSTEDIERHGAEKLVEFLFSAFGSIIPGLKKEQSKVCL